MLVALLLAALWPGGAGGAVTRPLPADAVALQGSSPFLRLLGIPRFETGLSRGGDSMRLSLDIVNHADRSVTAAESIELDGQSVYLDIALQKSVTDRLSLGLAIPFINHSGGSLDNAIEAWHDLFGLSNADRAGPANELSITYADAGRTVLQIDDSQSGPGDVAANAFWRLGGSEGPFGARFGLMAQVELPTGDADKLFGNGAADVSVGLLFDDMAISRGGDLRLSGAGGVTWPGSGDLLEARRRDLIAYGGIDLAWRVAAGWQLQATLWAHTAGFDSNLAELGRGSVQLAVGGRLALTSEGNLFLDAGIIEDLVSDSTPDFTVLLSLRAYR